MIKVGLNIGNSKISCAVSEIEKNKKTKLLSFQSFQTNIIKKNIITNFEELSNDIKSLISESEKKSQTKINSINLNTPMIDSVSKYYDSEIENLDQQISDLDIKKLLICQDILMLMMIIIKYLIKLMVMFLMVI